MSTNDFWRTPNWFGIIKPKNGYKGASSRPEDNTFHDGCTEDNMSDYSGHIYVVYDKRKGSNMYYVGSTFQSAKNRKEWHIDEAFGKMATSRHYVWLRDRFASREEAMANLILVWIHHVHFPSSLSLAEKKKILTDQYEKAWITKLYKSGRSLNMNLVPTKKTHQPTKDLKEVIYNRLSDILEECDEIEEMRSRLEELMVLITP